MLPPTICKRNTPQREMLSNFEKGKAGGRGGDSGQKYQKRGVVTFTRINASASLTGVDTETQPGRISF